MAAPLRAAGTWAGARSDVGCAAEVPGDGEVDKPIPRSCISALGSGNSLCYPKH